MKLRCTHLNAAYSHCLGNLFAVGAIFTASAHALFEHTLEIVDSYGGKWACSKTESGNVTIKATSGDIASFSPVGKVARLNKTEKGVKAKYRRNGKLDKRRKRRMYRQYEKLRFTFPQIYSFDSGRMFKRLARNG